MSTPKPADEIAEVFNAAVDLAGEDLAGLERAIDGDLDEFYLNHGIDPGTARSLLGELVLPVAARFPVGEGLAHEMA